jgi:hypothetical protein
MSRFDNEPLGNSHTGELPIFAWMLVSLTVVAAELPVLRTKPSYEALLEALKSLVIPPTSWNGASQNDMRTDAKGVSQYLLSIISSDLAWLDKDDEESDRVSDQKDELWELASRRLAERCGRSGEFLQ